MVGATLAVALRPHRAAARAAPTKANSVLSEEAVRLKNSDSIFLHRMASTFFNSDNFAGLLPIRKQIRLLEQVQL